MPVNYIYLSQEQPAPSHAHRSELFRERHPPPPLHEQLKQQSASKPRSSSPSCTCESFSQSAARLVPSKPGYSGREGGGRHGHGRQPRVAAAGCHRKVCPDAAAVAGGAAAVVEVVHGAAGGQGVAVVVVDAHGVVLVALPRQDLVQERLLHRLPRASARARRRR